MAQAASSIGGKHLKDIPDIYLALGLTPTVKKDSLIVIQNYKDGDNFKERFDAYEISEDASLIRSVQLRDDDTISNTSYNAIGMPVAVSTRYSDGTMPLAVVHASRVTNSATNPFNYYVDKPAYDGKKPSLSRTVTAKSPQTPSGYMLGFQQIVGIKSGILLPGNPREFFAFATTWPSSYAREVFRIDLFSLSSDVKDFKHEKSITLDTATTNGGYFMRIATGNFMGSGKKEIAVLSNHIDTWKFHLNVYSLEMVNNGKELYITHLVKDMEVYKNDAKVDYKERDMWFRKAMGDIVMADFDGDGRDEIAVIYKGYAEDWSNYSNTEKTISNNMKENFGTFWGSIHVDMFKYDATGKTARKTNSATRNYSEASDDTSEPDSAILNQYTLKPVGDLKAVAADIDGDGKYELAMLVVLWDVRFLWYSVAQNYMRWGNWSSRLDIWSFSNDSKSLLKPSFLKTAADFGKFYESAAQTAVSDMTAQSNRSALAYGTFAEQAFSLVAGSFTGMYNTQTGRLCDDIAVSRASLEGINHGYPECWVKILQPAYDAKGILSSFKVTTPYSFNDSGNTKKYTTIGLAAGDFFKSGIILKEPVHWVVTGQQVPVALVPTPPYHVDYIPLPWSTNKNPKLANISYIPDTTLT